MKEIKRKYARLFGAILPAVILSGCTSLNIGEPIQMVQILSFQETEMETKLGEINALLDSPLSIRSIEGMSNGYADIRELVLPEPVKGNEVKTRELRLHPGRSPLIYTPGKYAIPLIDILSYAPKENNYETPPRSHLASLTIQVGKSDGHSVHNNSEHSQMAGYGLTKSEYSIGQARTTMSEAKFRQYYGALLQLTGDKRKTVVHPKMETLPALTEYVDYPGDSGAGEVALTTIRREAEDSKRIYEGFMSGSHNVYLALVTNRSTESSIRKVAIFFVVYETSDDLLEALEGAVDQDGFDVVTNKNSTGFYPDGTSDDGRFFDGFFSAEGRQGRGTTFFTDGSSISGVYLDDVLTGFAVQTLNGGNRIFGWWQGEEKNGSYIVAPAEGEPYIADYTDNELDERRGYENPLDDDRWIWLAAIKETVDTESDKMEAVYRDGRTFLKQLPEGEVNILYPDGFLYFGPFLTDWSESVEGRIVYPNGSTYTGMIRDQKAHGEGELRMVDGTRYRGEFVEGKRDGKMIVVKEGEATTALFYKGEPVDDGEGGEGRDREPQARMSMQEYLEKATDGYIRKVNALQQKRAEEAAAAFAAVASVTMDVLEETGTFDTSNLSAEQMDQYQSFRSNVRSVARENQLFNTYQDAYDFQKAVQSGDLRTMKRLTVKKLQEAGLPEIAEAVNTWGDLAVQTYDNYRQAVQEQKLRQQQTITKLEKQRRVPSAKSPHWQSPGGMGKPTFGAESVQLSTLVQGADAYYQMYLQALNSGNTQEAERIYQVHQKTVENAWQLVAMM